MSQRRRRRHSHKTPSKKQQQSSLLPLFISAGAFLGLALGLLSGQWLLMIALGTGLGWLIGRQIDNTSTKKRG